MNKAYIDFKALNNVNHCSAFFIRQAREDMDYMVTESNSNIDAQTGLRGDKTILLNGHKSKKRYPEQLRLVEYYDDEKQTELMFLTNNFEVSALEVARLYRNRCK